MYISWDRNDYRIYRVPYIIVVANITIDIACMENNFRCPAIFHPHMVIIDPQCLYKGMIQGWDCFKIKTEWLILSTVFREYAYGPDIS